MKLNDKITATYITGEGKEVDEGKFIVKKITTTFAFLEMTAEGFFAQYPNWKIRKIPLKDFKGRREPMPEWNDNEFTCYHNQSGTPTIYKVLGREL
jgi:hypothetical protein